MSKQSYFWRELFRVFQPYMVYEFSLNKCTILKKTGYFKYYQKMIMFTREKTYSKKKNFPNQVK